METLKRTAFGVRTLSKKVHVEHQIDSKQNKRTTSDSKTHLLSGRMEHPLV